MKQETEIKQIPGLPDPYTVYNGRASTTDHNFVKDCNESMDAMMVFAGLFSAVISTLISTTSSMLLPDPQDRTHQLLFALVNATRDQDASTEATTFVPTNSAIVINVLYFLGLVLSLGAALGAMLVKQWARQYELSLGHDTIPWQRARNRHGKYQGLHTWKLEDIVAILPLLLHAALLLFLIGTLLWARSLHTALYISLLLFLSIGATIYVVFAVIPTFSTSAPFNWPISNSLRWGLRTMLRSFESFRRRTRSSPRHMEEGDKKPGPDYIATPYPKSLEASSQLTPPIHTIDDASVLMDLLCRAEVYGEVESAMEAIIRAEWRGLNLSPLILEHGDVIFQQYHGLSASCWEGRLLPQKNIERARRLCRFIEWIYYQLNVDERRHLQSWPGADLAEAFGETSREDGQLVDIVLASSVISKLNHINKGSCSLCWSKQPDETRYNDITNASRDLESKPTSEMKRLQELLSACIWSDTDCVLHYAHAKGKDGWRDLVGNVLKDASKSFFLLNKTVSDPYPKLLPLLASHAALLNEEDPRKQWFLAIDNLRLGKGAFS